MKRSEVNVTAICPEVHDLAVSKCVAARDKDADFIRGLLRHQMVDLETLLQRIATLDPARFPVDAILAWTRRRALEAANP